MTKLLQSLDKVTTIGQLDFLQKRAIFSLKGRDLKEFTEKANRVKTFLFSGFVDLTRPDDEIDDGWIVVGESSATLANSRVFV
jgi:hypothetical protein